MDIAGIVILLIIAIGLISAFAEAVMDGDHLWGLLYAALTFLACWGISGLFGIIMERTSG